MLVVVVLAGATWLWFQPSLGGDEDGVRVDVRDEVAACTTDGNDLCGGSGPPEVAVDAERKRILVVWAGSYEPSGGDVYARELDAEGKPLGQPIALGRLGRTGTLQPLVAHRPGGGWEIEWGGRVHAFSPELRPLGVRRGSVTPDRDPNVTGSDRGAVARVPGGPGVEVYLSIGGEIRADPAAS